MLNSYRVLHHDLIVVIVVAKKRAAGHLILTIRTRVMCRQTLSVLVGQFWTLRLNNQRFKIIGILIIFDSRTSPLKTMTKFTLHY